jgi:transcriptional regulator with XRE-family HTH domain
MEGLKELRRLRALGQQKLADAAGVGRNTISHIERGETGAHGRTLRRLARVLQRIAVTLDRKDHGRRDTCAFHQSDFSTPLCEVGQPLCKAL